MHLKHILSSMMLFRLMQTGGMIFLIKMILKKLQWITTVTWHGIRGAIMQLASVNNMMMETDLQVK